MADKTAAGQIIVNRNELAQFYSVTVMTVDDWFRQGMPVIQKGGRGGKPWKIDLAAAVKWREAQIEARFMAEKGRLEEKALKNRSMEVDLEGKELELAKRKSEVVAISDFERLMGDMIGTIRARLLHLPSALASLIDREAIERVKQTVNESLAELAAYEPSDSLQNEPAGVGESKGKGASDDAPVPAPAKPDRKRVGRKSSRPKRGKQRAAG